MLHNKYRPTSFEEFGNPAFTKVLKTQHNNPKGCYIFLGGSSVGKTTIARIMAKGNNSIELDGANVGIDKINSIKEECRHLSLDGLKRFYIIDEAHLISYSAMQGLLKLLEEPPANITFILCTTEVHKLPETIFSRAMVIKFPDFTVDFIYNRLEYVCKQEGIGYNEVALMGIAETCKGNLRMALNELELYKEDLSLYASENVIDDKMVEMVLDCINNKKPLQLVINDYRKLTLAMYGYLVRNYKEEYRDLLLRIDELQWRLRTSPIPKVEFMATMYLLGVKC